jgi:hypothetical protein
MACKKRRRSVGPQSGFRKIRRQDMDLYDVEREPRATNSECATDEREADASATSLPFDATELHSSPLSRDREGKSHRASQRPFLIRRLG